MDFRRRYLTLGAAAAVVAGAVGTLASPTLFAQTRPPAVASRCVAGLAKSVDPAQIDMGDTVRVTMVVTHTCPEELRPIDIVFLVDVSNSMTRAKNKTSNEAATPEGNATPGSSIGEPTPPPNPNPFMSGLDLGGGLDQTPSDPTPDPSAGGNNPGIKPGADPSGCEGAGGSAGGGGGVIVPEPGKATATAPGPQPPPGTPGSGADPTKEAGNGGVIEKDTNPELGGTEDLIRESQRWLRAFVDRPEIQADLTSGKLRLGMVAFNDRGRRLLSLTSDGKNIVSRLGLLRGDGKTRIDVGLRAAERVFVENVRGQIKRDSEHVRVIAVISDGQFCTKDVARARVDKDIRVLSIAAGRGANLKKLRQIASDASWVYTLREGDIKQVLKLYQDRTIPSAIAQYVPVNLTSLSVRDTLSDTMELVTGSVNPPPSSLAGRSLEWVIPNPAASVTLTFDVRPLSVGDLPISASSRADWTDSQKRTAGGDFPAVNVQVAPPR